MKRTLTVCPYCGTGCMFHLVSDGGRLIGIEPSVPHPVSRGSLCVKGWNAFAFVHHPDRLTTPLVRKHGELRPATWDEALDLTVERLQAIRDGLASQSIGSQSESYRADAASQPSALSRRAQQIMERYRLRGGELL